MIIFLDILERPFFLSFFFFTFSKRDCRFEIIAFWMLTNTFSLINKSIIAFSFFFLNVHFKNQFIKIPPINSMFCISRTQNSIKATALFNFETEKNLHKFEYCNKWSGIKIMLNFVFMHFPYFHLSKSKRWWYRISMLYFKRKLLGSYFHLKANIKKEA